MLKHRLFTNFYLIVYTISSLALGGCSLFSATKKQAVVVNDGDKAPNSNIALPCKLNTLTVDNKSTVDKQTNYKISLTIDGSGSMLGYVKNGNSRYAQVLKLLDQITLAHPGGVEYSRIDDSKKLIERNEFQKTSTSEFYTGKTSKIADAFSLGVPKSKPDRDRLLVIVTDLLPDDGDVALVSKRILEDYLKKDGQAVAIWGIRSDFDGLVYPPNNAPSYSYTSKSIEKGRPFYILLAGDYMSIVEFAKTLRSQSGDLFATQSKFTVFTPSQFIKMPTYLADPKNDLPNGIDKRGNLSANDNFSIDVPEDQPVKLLEFGENSNKEGTSIKYELDQQINPDTAIPSNLEPKYQTRKYNDDSEKPDFIGTDTPQSLTLTSAMTTNKLNVEFKLNPATFPQGLYYTTVDLIAKTIVPPATWADWNEAGKKDGSKTEGLNDFLKTLSVNTSAAMQTNPPIFARLCYGFKRN